MARPIQPTPTLNGRDVDRLMNSLRAVVCSPEERARRTELARKRRKEMMRPKLER